MELVYYDDGSNPAQVPGIYTKLLDVDHVDLVVSGYATAIIAPAMPVVMQRGMAFVSLFGAGVNTEFHYDRYVNMSPGGSDIKNNFAKGFIEIAAAIVPAPKSIALVYLDSDFPQRACESARFLAGQRGMKVVYDRAYPPTTVDFAPIMRAVMAARPDVVFVGSYPPDSASLLRAASELRVNVPLFGGSMIGPQISAQKVALGPILNNLVCWDVNAPEPTLQFSGTRALIERYQPIAAKEGTDALGYYIPPLAYAQMQVMQQAVTRARQARPGGDRCRLPQKRVRHSGREHSLRHRGRMGRRAQPVDPVPRRGRPRHRAVPQGWHTGRVVSAEVQVGRIPRSVRRRRVDLDWTPTLPCC